MNDMRDCYDRLLSAAAATANSVYGISLVFFVFSLISYVKLCSKFSQ